LGLIGLGAVGGVLYALAAAAGVIYIAVTGIEDNGPLMASSRLIGPSIGLLGVGILALLCQLVELLLSELPLLVQFRAESR
jgi:hypothetical protein